MYNPAFFEEACPAMCQVVPDFDCRRFIHRVFDNRWPDLGCNERVTHIAIVLHELMPANFAASAKLLIELSKRLTMLVSAQSFELMFIPEYIRLYGQAHPEESLRALNDFRQLINVEFAAQFSWVEQEDLAFVR
jgi:hypothetical protein